MGARKGGMFAELADRATSPYPCLECNALHLVDWCRSAISKSGLLVLVRVVRRGEVLVIKLDNPRPAPPHA